MACETTSASRVGREYILATGWSTTALPAAASMATAKRTLISPILSKTRRFTRRIRPATRSAPFLTARATWTPAYGF